MPLSTVNDRLTKETGKMHVVVCLFQQSHVQGTE